MERKRPPKPEVALLVGQAEAIHGPTTSGKIPRYGSGVLQTWWMRRLRLVVTFKMLFLIPDFLRGCKRRAHANVAQLLSSV